MREIGKLIIGIILVSLLPSVMAIDNLNTEVDELREHVFLVINEGNNTAYSYIVNNPDQRQQFVSVQIIPAPDDTCRSAKVTCNQSLYDTTIDINYNGNTLVADTSSCWDWWVVPGAGLLGIQEQEENKTLCPVVNIPFSPYDAYWNVTFHTTTTEVGKASLGIIIRVFDWSTAYTDKEIRYSSTADESIQNNASLISFNINFWKLVYYSVVIVLVVVGAIIIIGGIPLSIKWIVSKMRG